jgi:hypothetical protein
MPNSARLIETSVMLREHAPESWEYFVQAARDYAFQVAAELVRCDPVQLQRGQGLAIQANEMATIFENAPRLYEQMRQAKERGVNANRQATNR